MCVSGKPAVSAGSLPGNAEEYSFDRIERMEDSPLLGKRICLLGSSVTFGSASGEQAVGEYLARRLGADITKEAVNGTTLVDTGPSSYIQRMLTRLDAGAHYDLFLCQLSTNDATKAMPLGEAAAGYDPDRFDTSTVTGALEYIIAYAERTWRCPVALFTGTRYDSSAYEAMVERLLELKEKWNICVVDLWSDDGFNDLPDGMRAVYMRDGIHPTRAGYRDWWGPEIARQLCGWLTGAERQQGHSGGLKNGSA